MEKNRCVIFSGAKECYLDPEAGLAPSDYVIACDRGYLHAIRAGIAPDLAVGDFDSYRGKIGEGTKVFRASPQKDDTDTMLAVKTALDLGFSRIILLGATGGRIDHTLANISAAAFIAQRGGDCVIYDENFRIHAIKNSLLRLPKGRFPVLSVFSHRDTAEGVWLRGVKYPLQNAVLTNTFPLGVSNEFEEDYAEIQVENGILIVVLTKEEHP